MNKPTHLAILKHIAPIVRRIHPPPEHLSRLVSPPDGWVRYASRVERALSMIEKTHPDWLKGKCRLLERDRDPKNQGGILGEIRTFANLLAVWGDGVRPQHNGADFLVQGVNYRAEIEVTTAHGAADHTTLQIESSRFGHLQIQVDAHAPFGYATEYRPEDTVQGNAVSRLAAFKGPEKQFSGDGISVLWLNVDDPIVFPLSLLDHQHFPLISGREELVSGAIWWAFYGEKGDEIYDRLSLTGELPLSYELEFDGRFAASSRIDILVVQSDSRVVALENHRHRCARDAFVADLARVAGFRIEESWLEWHSPEPLENRISAERARVKGIRRQLDF